MDFSFMNKLELDEGNVIKENEEPQEVTENQYSQDDMIKASCQIVEVLSHKRQLHNKSYSDNKVSLSELKTVFVSGARDCSENKNEKRKCIELGIARINMFLRMKAGEKIEITDAKVRFDGSIDVSECFVPSEEDFEQALKDIEEHGMNVDFASIDDLYLGEDKTKLEDIFEL